jgi:hypothetical protein
MFCHSHYHRQLIITKFISNNNLCAFFSGFDSDTASYDIAILFTNFGFTIFEEINRICLPSRSDLSEVSKEECILTGWGQSSTGLLHFTFIIIVGTVLIHRHCSYFCPLFRICHQTTS